MYVHWFANLKLLSYYNFSFLGANSSRVAKLANQICTKPGLINFNFQLVSFELMSYVVQTTWPHTQAPLQKAFHMGGGLGTILQTTNLKMRERERGWVGKHASLCSVDIHTCTFYACVVFLACGLILVTFSKVCGGPCMSCTGNEFYATQCSVHVMGGVSVEQGHYPVSTSQTCVGWNECIMCVKQVRCVQGSIL